MDKAPDAFRTISEVADDLDLPQHVLRFWETRFTQIKPLKRGGGRRYYRPDDVDLLKGIRYYLYGEGYTIKGVQRILKERGVKHVTELGRAQTENYVPPVATLPRIADAHGEDIGRDDWPEAAPPPGRRPLPFNTSVDAEPEPPFKLPPVRPEARVERDQVFNTQTPARPAAAAPVPAATARAPSGGSSGATLRLAADDLRRLKAAMFELAECKRILDVAR